MAKQKAIRYDADDQLKAGWIIMHKKLRTKSMDDKAGHLVATLLVPPDAHAIIGDYNSASRVADNDLRKLRVSEAMVLDIIDSKGKRVKFGFSSGLAHKKSKPLKYIVGKTVKPGKFDKNCDYACGNGIHGFLEREQAIDWKY